MAKLWLQIMKLRVFNNIKYVINSFKITIDFYFYLYLLQMNSTAVKSAKLVERRIEETAYLNEVICILAYVKFNWIIVC